jgi:hypothetical protein
MKISTSTLVACGILLLFAADFAPSSPLHLGFISDAQAVIGRPMTPVSYAGAARRSVYAAPVAYHGAAVATAAVVTTAAVASASASQAEAAAYQQGAAQASAYQQGVADGSQAAAAGAPAIGTIVTELPPGCSTVALNGIEYNNCNGVYYRATFQGNNLVYVVQSP